MGIRLSYNYGLYGFTTANKNKWINKIHMQTKGDIKALSLVSPQITRQHYILHARKMFTISYSFSNRAVIVFHTLLGQMPWNYENQKALSGATGDLGWLIFGRGPTLFALKWRSIVFVDLWFASFVWQSLRCTLYSFILLNEFQTEYYNRSSLHVFAVCTATVGCGASCSGIVLILLQIYQEHCLKVGR